MRKEKEKGKRERKKVKRKKKRKRKRRKEELKVKIRKRGEASMIRSTGIGRIGLTPDSVFAVVGVGTVGMDGKWFEDRYLILKK